MYYANSKNGFTIYYTANVTPKMEPYIKLMNTEIDLENERFVDKIHYDGYDFSFVVGTKNIESVLEQLSYLFESPKVSGTPNIANMNFWEFRFYDDRGRECQVEKNGEHIYFMLPRYQIISTDVSSGIAYLRIFHDTLKHLANMIDSPLNKAQIIFEDDD